MHDAPNHNQEYVQWKYLEAIRFAWMLMVGLAFVGSIIAQVALHELMASTMLAAVSLTGLIAQDLYLTWTFRGTVPPLSEKLRIPVWQSIAIRAAFVAGIALLLYISDAGASVRSVVVAVVSGVGAAFMFWWQEVYAFRTKKRESR